MVGHQRRQPSRKLGIRLLLRLPACGGGLAGGLAGGKPAPLAALRLGIAPSLLLRFRACLSCSPQILGIGHWSSPNHPCGSRGLSGSKTLRVRHIRLRGIVAASVGGGLVRQRRAGARHAQDVYIEMGPTRASDERTASPLPVGHSRCVTDKTPRCELSAWQKAEVRAERVSIRKKGGEGFRGEACHGEEAGKPRGGRAGGGRRRPGRDRPGKSRPAADPRPRKNNRYGRYARAGLDEMRVSALLYSIG